MYINAFIKEQHKRNIAGRDEGTEQNKQTTTVTVVIKLHAFMPVGGCIKSKTNGIKWPVKNQMLLEMSATFILNIHLQSSLHTLKCVTTKI